MRDRPRPFRPVRDAALAIAACVLVGAVHATPEAVPADGFTRFLSDQGLLPAPATVPGLATQVRDKASELVVTAMNFLGVPYKRGGSSQEKGFDCSGFTRHIFETSFGLLLPRRVDDQASAAGLVPVRKEDLRPGDLVFFNTLKRTFSHVGIYIGEGRFIHSPRPGGEVRVESMGVAYWTQRFTGARRAEVVAAPAPAASAPAP